MSATGGNTEPRKNTEAHTQTRPGNKASETASSGSEADKNQIRPPRGLIILISGLGIAAVVVFALLRYIWPGETGS